MKQFLNEKISFVINSCRTFQTEAEYFTVNCTSNLSAFYLIQIPTMIQKKFHMYSTTLSIPFFALKAWHEGLPLSCLHFQLPFVPAKIKYNKQIM
jgi:hypothetical protein